jgi:hypothetical protein
VHCSQEPKQRMVRPCSSSDQLRTAQNGEKGRWRGGRDEAEVAATPGRLEGERRRALQSAARCSSEVCIASRTKWLGS